MRTTDEEWQRNLVEGNMKHKYKLFLDDLGDRCRVGEMMNVLSISLVRDKLEAS